MKLTVRHSKSKSKSTSPAAAVAAGTREHPITHGNQIARRERARLAPVFLKLSYPTHVCIT